MSLEQRSYIPQEKTIETENKEKAAKLVTLYEEFGRKINFIDFGINFLPIEEILEYLSKTNFEDLEKQEDRQKYKQQIVVFLNRTLSGPIFLDSFGVDSVGHNERRKWQIKELFPRLNKELISYHEANLIRLNNFQHLIFPLHLLKQIPDIQKEAIELEKIIFNKIEETNYSSLSKDDKVNFVLKFRQEIMEKVSSIEEIINKQNLSL